MSGPIVQGMRRLGQGLRDGWLMVGVTLLFLVGLEVAYRAQSGVRHALTSARGPGPVRGPYADSAWYPAYLKEYDATFAMHWKPFVYFRRPAFAGQFINVDSVGHRPTVHPTPPAGDTIRVFFFGGSTMWGSYLRDGATIPSVASQRLAATAPPGVTFDVTNFGESGYTFTQEVLELELQLRAGNVPDVVMFYDGMCDIGSAAQFGQVGVSQNESNRAREFELGRAVFGSETGVGSDFRAVRAIAGQISQRFQLFQRIFAMVARPGRPTRTPEQLGPDVARIYAATADLVEPLSRAYGFKVLYVWQPLLSAAAKSPTPFEKTLLSQSEHDDYQQRVRTLHLVVTPLLDSALKARVGPRFVNEVSLFAGDTISVFTDNQGHNTEKAIPPIVAGFFPALKALVDSVHAEPRHQRRVRAG
jgi:lysophospholipase L1-like esterase